MAVASLGNACLDPHVMSGPVLPNPVASSTPSNLNSLDSDDTSRPFLLHPSAPCPFGAQEWLTERPMRPLQSSLRRLATMFACLTALSSTAVWPDMILSWTRLKTRIVIGSDEASTHIAHTEIDIELLEKAFPKPKVQGLDMSMSQNVSCSMLLQGVSSLSLSTCEVVAHGSRPALRQRGRSLNPDL